MHVQENSQCQCRLHCAKHDCGHAKRPHRLVPRAGPGQNKGALRCNLGARSPGKQRFRGTCPGEFLATFCAQPASAPGTCRPLGAKRPERHAGGGGSPTRWKEIGWHHSSTPHGQGCGLGTFLPGGAASRRASTKTATRLCGEKTRQVAQPRRKYAQKVQCERCVVDLSAMVSQIAWFYLFLLRFLMISVPRRSFRRFLCNSARAKRVHAKSDVWVEVFGLFLFSMIYYCKLVIAVVLMLVDDVAMCCVYSVCVEQDICMWKK